MRQHTTPPDFITYCEREAEAERLWQRVEELYRQETPDPHHTTKGEQSCCKESSEESK
jgi:hypothetical protein